MPPRSSIEHFWCRVDVRGPEECWEWQGYCKSGGYGKIKFQGKIWLTHRLALSTVQHVPDDMCVLHSCDNPPCVNPAHLRLGTQLENVRDRNQKGRTGQPKGTKNGNAKLTDAEAFFIRYADITHKELAKLFDISEITISDIKTGRRWKHLP